MKISDCLKNYLNGSQKDYDQLIRETKKYLKKLLQKGPIFNKKEKCWEYKVTEDFATRILHYLYEEFVKPEYQNDWREEKIKKAFFRKIKDYVGTHKQKENRISNIKTTKIYSTDWQGINKKQKTQKLELWRLRKLYYRAYQRKKSGEQDPSNTLQYAIEEMENSWQLHLTPTNPNFCDFVTQQHNIMCKIVLSAKGPTRESLHQGCFRFISKLHSRIQLPYKKFSRSHENTLTFSSCDLPKEQSDGLYSMLKDGKANLQIYISTGFEMVEKRGEYYLSLENFTKYLTAKNLFSSELPGNLLATHSHFQEEQQHLEDYHGKEGVCDNSALEEIQKKYLELKNLMELHNIDMKSLADLHCSTKLVKKNKIPKSTIIIIHESKEKINEDRIDFYRNKKDLYEIQRYVTNRRENNWEELTRIQKSQIVSFLEKAQSKIDIILLGQNYIPLAIHLGCILHGKDINQYEYNRDRKTWKWSLTKCIPNEIKEEGLPVKKSMSSRPVVIRVSISAVVEKFQVNEVIKEPYKDIHIFLQSPGINQLVYKDLFDEYSKSLQKAFRSISKFLPKTKGIHIFAATPTSASVEIGRSLQLSMLPRIYVYYFAKTSSPSYSLALILSAIKDYCTI